IPLENIIPDAWTGVDLRKRLKNGESVSPENQTGIVTIADVSALRIRVDLDETDVAKVRENQKAFITADAYGDQKFYGKVIKIGQILGRKNFRTERPTEKVDTKILEILIELAPDQKLPLGLRVDSFIEIEN
ncbi:MAG: efflux RND transporter periplasmic adaptor subunit, partial [Actinomycetota bacterium]